VLLRSALALSGFSGLSCKTEGKKPGDRNPLPR
jgi:hypothetical protein